MTTRFRLILLLGCLVAVFAAAFWGLQLSHRAEVGTIHATIREQRDSLADRVITLVGQSLRSFASDYAQWDEMVRFVESGDTAWAKINIDPSLANFNAQAVWVLRPDGRLVYQTATIDASLLAHLPPAEPAFLARLTKERQLHFYRETPAGLLEVRTAPILPSEDVRRTGPARGWFVVARLWDNAHLQVLAEALQAQVTFDLAPGKTDAPDEIHVERILPDWPGAGARTLHVVSRSPALTRLLDGNIDEVLVLVVFGAVMIVVTFVGLSRWVLGPLRRLGQSLESGQVAPLRDLGRSRNEFGHLARLVEQSFSHRSALEREVDERTRMARELQEAGTQLGESIELRGRLARDLHDGVIQSIYAAGLGLEGARSLLRTDPAAADQRLQAALSALNETIRDVRAFINTLESEAASPRPFRQTLATLIATLRSIQPGEITMEVDEAVARRIGPAQELHLLQILRESIGNALRHAGARTIRVSLLAGTEREAGLVVSDDGCGFDPAQISGRGRGLANLAIRAREMGGLLQIDSAPGKGARLTLHFNPTYPP